MENKFVIGREREIKRLNECYESKESQLVLVYGRRRVGKTFLINQTFDGRFDFKLTGAYNQNTDFQLNTFNIELCRQTQKDIPLAKTWLKAFAQLREYLDSFTDDEKRVVFFDEMPWLDTPKSGFLAAFEWFWNDFGSSKNNLVFIICGSATSWITDKIEHNKGGLFNRQNCRIFLEPFTLHETEEFLESREIHWSRYQITECYMILGGIPYYLNLLSKSLSFNQNIDNLFFRKRAELWDEFDNLYRTLFSNSENHIKVIEALFEKKMGLSRKEIASATKIADNASLTAILTNLSDSGFIRPYPFYGNKKHGTFYQLSDYYTLFYYKYIKGNYGKDEHYWSNTQENPSRKSWAGLTFEQVCKDHLRQIKQKIGISSVLTEVSSWVSKADEVHDGAQIDLIIDRRDHVINLCEIKFSLGEYVIDKDYDKVLRTKLSTFANCTKTKKALQLTMISTYGIKNNMYSGIVSSQVMLDDLFVK